MHTRGILVMTPDSAMVLTGKQALDYSGGVSAEDNLGIGGYDRVMGPNGQAQYWAADLAAACEILFAHYEHTLRRARRALPQTRGEHRPGRPRRPQLSAPRPEQRLPDRGRHLLEATNPERKKPFDIRAVMRAIARPGPPAARALGGMASAESAVVFDAHLGGYPVTRARHRVPTAAPQRLLAGRRT